MSVDPADALFPCLSTRICRQLSTRMRANNLLTVTVHHFLLFCTPHPTSLPSFPSGPLPPPAQSLRADYRWMSSHTMRSVIRH